VGGHCVGKTTLWKAYDVRNCLASIDIKQEFNFGSDLTSVLGKLSRFRATNKHYKHRICKYAYETSMF
jgi:hypothetical protein